MVSFPTTLGRRRSYVRLKIDRTDVASRLADGEVAVRSAVARLVIQIVKSEPPSVYDRARVVLVDHLLDSGQFERSPSDMNLEHERKLATASSNHTEKTFSVRVNR